MQNSNNTLALDLSGYNSPVSGMSLLRLNI